MKAIPLRDYIDDVYNGNVKAFAKARSLGTRIIYRDLEKKSGSLFVIYVRGVPSLIEVKSELPPLPANVSCDYAVRYPVSFTYDGLRYFVTRNLSGANVVTYDLNTIGDEPPALSLDYEIHEPLGLVRFSFSDAFELLVNEFGYWVNSGVLQYRVVTNDSASDTAVGWDSFEAAYRFCLDRKGELYFGDALIFASEQY